MTLFLRSGAIRRSLETLSGDSAETPACEELRIYPAGDSLCVGIRVSPSARKTQLRGLHGDRLKVAVAAPPEDNRANRELESALAGWLGVDSRQVRVCKGHTSRDKVVAFTELEEARLRRLLGAALADRRVTGDDCLG
jgi:uncharacterized protein (TIGR00251 family)